MSDKAVITHWMMCRFRMYKSLGTILEYIYYNTQEIIFLLIKWYFHAIMQQLHTIYLHYIPPMVKWYTWIIHGSCNGRHHEWVSSKLNNILKKRNKFYVKQFLEKYGLLYVCKTHPFGKKKLFTTQLLDMCGAVPT